MIKKAIQFLEKCRIENREGCWKWKGSKFVSGHGSFYLDGASTTANRASYKIFKGFVDPYKEVVRQRCENRDCVNPEHLYKETKSELRVKDHENRFKGRNLP